ncbi:hypothetical protein KXD93_00405 [Mucilaginibacter sp. BJC16-A38]|uniref:hypothetical protein n=1 Tax=Mucilaginibacter phenanthrenivorans TaxID=1234842 RepID=UPI0021575A50|nr:hypothetical protein [Mucilaginibacter phenanthrenivorans]MCR8556078.1 hypothetical protein [Mucilaginibacter phenanthrenivorans]
MTLYNRIWADAIISQKAKKAEHTSWKLYTLIPLSLIMGINLFTFFYWMRVIVDRNLLLYMPVNVFNAHPLNSFISIVITFIIPFVLLNYLVIFNNDQYNEVLKKYHDEGGRLYRKYVWYSLGIAIIPIVVKVMFFG